MEKTNEIKIWNLEKIVKIKMITFSERDQEKKSQFINMKNDRGAITTDPTGIKK
jgi:hypothetical protein